MQDSLGHWFLNISFFLYLILYLPQLIHNTKKPTFRHMSSISHYMLLQAYSCDLFYALSQEMPWQYLTVSCFGTLYLLIQHCQWLRFNIKNDYSKNKQMNLIGLIIIGWPAWLWFWFQDANWQIQFQIWLSKTLFILHFLPQILKNQQKHNNIDAISTKYLGLSISLNFTDLISAYCLRWDTANIAGGVFSLLLKLVFILQIIFYSKTKPRLSFLKIRSAL